MRILSPIVAVLALALATYLWIELSRAESLLRQQEIKTAALAPLQASLAASQAKARAAEQATQSQALLLRHLQEERKNLDKGNVKTPPESEAPTPVPETLASAKPLYSLDDGTAVFGPETRIRLPDGRIVSSPSGVMVSDASRTHLDGDLLVESPDGGQLLMKKAFVSFVDGKMTINMESLTKIK